MVTTFLHGPMVNYHCLSKAFDAIRPLAYQVLLFGYIAAFQLPNAMVRYLGVSGNYAIVRGAHKVEHGKDRTCYEPQHSLAMTMGPGEAECRTQTDEEKPRRYGESVLARAKEPGAWFLSSTAYYRDGPGFDKWEKSIHTLEAFYNIESENENETGIHVRKRRHSSASSTLFSEIHADSFKAPTTLIWGKNDHACTEAICLNGLSDYLARDSQVLMLPDSGHWTAIERASRDILKRILECLVQSGDIEKKDLQKIAEEKYPNAFISIDK